MNNELKDLKIFFLIKGDEDIFTISKLLKSFKITQKVHTPKELALSVTFKKNKHIGNRIKNIGEKILKKTIKEIDNFITDEF